LNSPKDVFYTTSSMPSSGSRVTPCSRSSTPISRTFSITNPHVNYESNSTQPSHPIPSTNSIANSTAVSSSAHPTHNSSPSYLLQCSSSQHVPHCWPRSSSSSTATLSFSSTSPCVAQSFPHLPRLRISVLHTPRGTSTSFLHPQLRNSSPWLFFPSPPRSSPPPASSSPICARA